MARRYLQAGSARLVCACAPPLADAARLEDLQGSIRSLLRPNKEPCGNRIVMSSTVLLPPSVLQCVADPLAYMEDTPETIFAPLEVFGAGGNMLAGKIMAAMEETAAGKGPGRVIYPIYDAKVLHEVDLGPPPRTPPPIARVFG